MKRNRRNQNNRNFVVGCLSIAILLSVAAIVIGLAERVEPDARTQLEAGGTLYQKGRFDEAIGTRLLCLAKIERRFSSVFISVHLWFI